MTNKKDNFNKFIYISLIFHGLVFAFLTVKVVFFPAPVTDYQRSVRVDVVALPEKSLNKEKPKVITKPKVVEQKKEAPKPKPKSKPKKVGKKKSKPKLKKKKNPNKFSEKKLKNKQNQAVEQLSATAKIKQRLEEKKKQQSKKNEFKGNQISKGFSPDGGLAKLHHEDYIGKLDSHIRDHWQLPEWLSNNELSARVLILVNKRGAIVSKSFILKSGNDLFDQQVFTTLDKASPLPIPPASLAKSYEIQGIEIRFPE